MPVDSVAAARRWRSRNIAGPDDSSDVNRLRAELIASRKRLIDLEYKERTRELIPANEVRDVFVAGGHALRSQHMQVRPQLLAHFPDVDPELLAMVDDLMRRALATMSDAVGRLIDGEDGEAA
jgi:hypothetical protein